MENSKLISILRCFGNKQMKQLRDFVNSPYFNKKEEVAKIFDVLMEYHPDFEPAYIAKEQIFSQALPGLPYNEKDMGYWMSDLVKLIEQFIVTEEIIQQPATQFPHLFKNYLRWNLEKPFQRTLKNALQYQQNYPLHDAQYYFNAFVIKEQEAAFFDAQKIHSHDESLQEAINNLDVYYLSQKLRYSCEMMNRKNMLIAGYRFQMLEEILQYLEKEPHNEIPPVAIYRAILLCLREPDTETHFDHLKLLLRQYAGSFAPEEARGMYIYAINYCVGKINRGNQHYLEELFHLYRQLLHDRIIFEDKYLSPWTYMNIVVVGIRNQQFEWTENFIHQYHQSLAPQFRENAYNYNLAYLYYNRQQYGKAQKLLSEVVFEDVFYSIEAKSLLLRIYYEINETDPLLALCDAFKIYLRRNKLIADNKRELYLNYIKFIARLSKIPKGKKEALQELLQQLNNTKHIVNLKWLQQKIQEKLT
ncbi:hypothetical protein C7N43_12380 [Sphingobacteriales bacterium UPWRP_1]|nr:hypothetical protein B6N25_14040 [Sphingobacteriales bacterium TSM_CSS]PSJ76730.1 hypothetical protein C7N43_12380 [Sphingobacteriales bacterium UPWRP_1]